MLKKAGYINEVLGVRVDSIPMDQVLKMVEKWLDSGEKHYIVTPNAEMVMLAQEDKEFNQVLNQADLAIGDGYGLKLADRRLKQVIGTDFMLALVAKGYKTLLVGGKPGVAQAAGQKLGVLGMTEPDIRAINRVKPELLFVALGHGKQEKWIAKNLPRLNVKVAMGVGGALDQVVKPWLRPPKPVQAMGLGWLWRLSLQPWRIKRQWQLVRFLWLMMKKPSFPKTRY